MVTQKLKLLDLFSGIGGFSLGLENSGYYQTIGFCEIDKYCQKVLKNHWPEVPIHDDITTLKGDMFGPIDAICGGFPCQDISVAGRGESLSGSRSGLWLEYLRLIKETKPKVVFIENVSALRSRGLDVILRQLSEIGYDAEWHCITASSFGAPHRRDRLWIMGYPRSTRWEGPINYDSLPSSQKETQSLNDYKATGDRCSMVLNEQSLREGYGLSVSMERRRLQALGNAVVPAIPQYLGTQVYQKMFSNNY